MFTEECGAMSQQQRRVLGDPAIRALPRPFKMWFVERLEGPDGRLRGSSTGPSCAQLGAGPVLGIFPGGAGRGSANDATRVRALPNEREGGAQRPDGEHPSHLDGCHGRRGDAASMRHHVYARPRREHLASSTRPTRCAVGGRGIGVAGMAPPERCCAQPYSAASAGFVVDCNIERE
jgi:hypothetical protein